MIPAGYMYKTIMKEPDWLNSDQVSDIYSVSSCMSEDFADWINFWKHNGHWLFDSPEIIKTIAHEHTISLHGMKLFFYYIYEQQWETDAKKWKPYRLEDSLLTDVVLPRRSKPEGYDIVSFSCQNSAECSPLSCNQMAQEIKVNPHCLLDSFEGAKQLLESDAFKDCEPGPYRIFAVHTVENT